VHAVQSTVTASSPVGTGISSTITITIRNYAGVVQAGITPVLSVSGAGNTVTQPGATNASGVATGSVSSSVAGTKVVTVVADSVELDSHPAVTVTASPVATQVNFGTQPGAVVEDAIMAPFTVLVQDAGGATVTSSTALVSIGVNSGPSGALLGGTQSRNAVAGVATFNDITCNNPGTYTLLGLSGGLIAHASNSFTVSAASGATWPNEFAGGTLVQDTVLNAAVPDTGASAQYYEPWFNNIGIGQRLSSNGYLSSVVDNTAPTPGACVQGNYPIGFGSDTGNFGEPGIVFRSGLSTTRMYFGFKVRVSPNWEGNNVNKFGFFYLQSKSQMFYFAARDNGRLFITTEMSTEPAQNTESGLVSSIFDNNWHTFEVEANISTTTVKVWLDGTLHVQRTTVPFTGSWRLQQAEVISTWGGGPNAHKDQNDWVRINHFRLRVA
jgi:hypothetical protein